MGITKMTGRLGSALYWVGCVAAALIVAFTVAIPVTLGGLSDNWPIFAALLVFAVLVWGFGRTCKYVLAGV